MYTTRGTEVLKPIPVSEVPGMGWVRTYIDNIVVTGDSIAYGVHKRHVLRACIRGLRYTILG